MGKRRRDLRISYSELTEHKKDKILDNIRIKGLSIKAAAQIWNVTPSTINKIFTERFGSRERKILELKQTMENEFNKIKDNE